jgi:hypothetical protein
MSKDLLPRLSTAQLQKHLIKQQGIGNKWAGTIGETQAKDYIHEEMKRYGIDTRIEEFPYLRYSNPRAAAAIVAPVQVELNCLPVSYYANTDAEGEAVYVGTGSPQEFEALKSAGADFTGKTVVAISDAPFMISSLVKEHGATALLTISDTPEPGLIRHCCGAFYSTTAGPTMPEDPFDFPVKITGAMIPIQPDGHQLLALMSLGKVRLKTTHRADYGIATSWNIIGEIKGSDRPDQKVIIGAHYDTEYEVPGVWDNAAGVAALLETARTIKTANVPLKRTLVFIAFGCEENGCWGSADYTKRYKEDLQKNCIAYFNLDAPSGIPTLAHTLWTCDELRDLMVQSANELGWKVHAIEGVAQTFSDYAPFRDLNIPNTWAWTYPPIHPYYHTEKDTLEFAVHLPDLAHVAEVTAHAALKVAMSDKRF